MTKKTIPRFNLLDALNKRTYEHAVICSFGFDVSFFEEYCLEKLSTLSSNGNISVLVDKNIYEEIILGPESGRPQKANLRYLFYPISVPGVFHPKLFLLASKNKGKLFVGSANFTRSGITSNAEMVGYYEYEAGKAEQFKPLFQQAFDYILSLASIYESDNLDSNLRDLLREADWLTDNTSPAGQDETSAASSVVSLIHNLEKTLWSQIIDDIEAPVDEVFILSRFFDKSPGFLDTVERDLQPEKISIYTQNGITNLSPEWLEHRLVKSGKAQILLCNYTDEGYLQPLHAKAIAIKKNKCCSFLFGSANFSTPALLRRSNAGNAEILLKLSGLSVEDFDPKEFFDPDKTAIRLTNASILQASRSDEEVVDDTRISHRIKLIEATVEAGEGSSSGIILIKAEIPIDLRFGDLQASLSFNNKLTRSLKLQQKSDEIYFVSITADIMRLLNDESTILNVESIIGDEVSISNSLLVTNLKDLKTDKPVRRERYIKEAQQSAVQFFSVLRELLDSTDDGALLAFLNYCDIPLGDFARPMFLREARPVWDGDGMRKFGEKNLKIYTELHPAAVAFFDKHFKKLQRQVERMEIGGVDNFLHIFLAMGGILRSQVERAVIGLESKGSAVTTDEWSDCRNYIDIYLGKFKQLMECLWKQYLSRMITEYKSSEVSEKFLPNLQPINDLCADMLSCRNRIEHIRTTKLKRVNGNGQVVTPSYFHSTLGAEKWGRYSSEIELNFKNVDQTIRLAS